MYKYPRTMATQHPDNSEKYIPIQDEPEEAIQALEKQEHKGLGIDEIMIDFEGKLTPYHQTSQIALGLIAKGLVPGKDVRITPRIPNAIKEPVFRQLMSIMSLVETNILLYKNIDSQAIIETIVPMIESGQELNKIQTRINSVIELGNKNYDIQFPADSIKIIPLIETVPAIIKADEIIEEYHLAQKKKGLINDSYRLMLARSDSAMSYGMVSSVLSIKIALSKLADWSLKNQVEIAPILGCGSLPFRGHLTGKNLKNTLKTYSGVKTFTIQSGLRYDHGSSEVKKVVRELNKHVVEDRAQVFTVSQLDKMKEYIGIFTKHYLNLFNMLIGTIDFVSKKIPKNRDRLAASKSSLEYVREFVDLQEVADLVADPELKKDLLSIDTNLKYSIPRAISFTSSLYTIGMPPEFIGTGRALEEIFTKYGQKGLEELILFYPSLKTDLEYAANFVNSKVAKGIAGDEARKLYEENFQVACKILGLKVQDKDILEGSLYHTLLASARPILLHLTGSDKDLFSDTLEEEKVLKKWIIKMGLLRGSLG